MEESAEIKADPSSSRTAWIRGCVADCGRRVYKALSYISGEMKECGEGLKGKGAATRPPPVVPRETLGRSSQWPGLSSVCKDSSFAVGTDLCPLGRGCSRWKRAAPIAEHDG